LRADETCAPPVAAVLERLRHDATDIADDVHRLSHRLHSSTLDFLGLGPALQKLVSEFSERHDIPITFSDAKLKLSPPPHVALCLFRIVEEALANIARHSRARSAHVQVTAEADGMHLLVEDTGIGFDPAILQKKAGLGFVSMQERLRVLHGTVRVDSVPSRGTKIAAWVPSASLATAAAEGQHGVASTAEPAPTMGPA
jgi:signal transduction histidine kinase